MMWPPEKFLDKIPEIIREVRTPWGLLALIVVVLSVIALAFFQDTSQLVKLSAFVLAILGAGFIATSTLRVIPNPNVSKVQVGVDQNIPEAFGHGGLMIYNPRTGSDNEMLTDVKRNHHIVFLGISHQDLDGYLKNILKSTTDELPLQSITIIYASREHGRIWEGEQFLDNIKQSRQNIASVLTNPEWSRNLPKLQSVSFKQSTHHSTFGGCLMRDSKGAVNTMYIVNYLPSDHRDTRRACTFRIAQPAHKEEIIQLQESYCESYDIINNEAKDLGTIKPDLWDSSVAQWSEFSKECRAHISSMHDLVELSELEGDEKTIDLAAGSGHVSQIILDKLPNGQLTLLDASQQMIDSARKIHGNRTKYALARVPVPESQVLIDLEVDYDVIFINLSLPAIASSVEDLRKVAAWCKSVLKDSGKVMLSCHNTAVEISSSTYDKDHDILRATLIQAAKARGIECRPLNREKFSQTNVKEAFASAGFQCLEHCERNYEMTMSDRQIMWSTPVVLNSLFEVSQLSDEIRRELIKTTMNQIENDLTPPMVVGFWKFCRVHH